MVLFEKVVAFLEIAPESDQCFLMGVRRCQCFQPFVREPRRENPNWQMLLIPVMGQDGEPIDLFDAVVRDGNRSEEHTSELQSPCNLVCRLLLEKKKKLGLHPVTSDLSCSPAT